ncbi:uncharacterized protein LOC128548284 [Mercenaria mercenaria]|uniref:uncharacterized protein LOC128548284 n=1 Tax=Mercenaria mercenaria TaxID=6596 RepID=UPI00234F2091|nr:uncharacterized protein LOC128548284 [Mercenaria mercenaria]
MDENLQRDSSSSPSLNSQNNSVSDQMKLVLDELRTQRRDFLDLKEELQGSSRTVVSEVNKLKTEKSIVWKFQGNKIQYEFNSDIDESVKQVQWAIGHGKIDYASEVLTEVLNKLKKRNKLIRIADSSSAGWDTVKLYESNPIASDEEDEAKISKAENRALKRKKNSKSASNVKRSATTKFPQVDYIAPARPFTRGQELPTRPVLPDFGRGTSFRPSFGAYSYGPQFTGYSAAAPGPCFACGSFSHFRRDCPFTTRSAGNQSAARK